MAERSIFLAALELHDPAARREYLARMCAGDAILRGQVEELLRLHEQLDGFMQQPAAAMLATIERPPAIERPGDVIGPYKLLEAIGEGGFGVVFMAEQMQPVRRKVALKILKPGMETGQVVARFEAERQALALMDHPNIARVFDGGATHSGRPYFVMELVRGLPITEFCDQNQLTPRERLELFIPVCQAVQHAHQKGIIHRDLKPSNVLVTMHDATPVVKVIDFGIAKALGQELTDKTLFTGFAQMVGTPLYMSPEQTGMSSLDVDTRTDIYSLGVLLYELLTGTTPFTRERFQRAAYDEIRRIIREEEPPKPSTRLSESKEKLPSISAQRHMEPAKLRKLVRGELDWIVMKCLEKDRNRRYATANGFAVDIQRYLADEPVQACPPSAWYRFRKFARRNKRALATMTVMAIAVLVVMVALAVSNVLIQRETVKKEAALKEKTEALTAAQTSERNAKFQEGVAKKNANRAETERRKAEAQEKIARQEELTARRRFYAAQMNLAMQAWEAGNSSRVLDLLESQRPRFDEEDLRTFEWYYLWRLCHAQLRFTSRAHDKEITCVAFSPDGKTLASASDDTTVKLWNVSTGQELSSLNGHGFRAAVTFSPDGKILVTAGYVGKGEVWDVATGRRLPIDFPEHSMERAVAFSPDGKTLAGGNYSGEIKLWDVASWQLKATIKAHPSTVGSLMFSPDGTTLSSTTAWGDRTVKVWDLTVEPPRLTRQLSGVSAMSVAFSPDGKTLATGGGKVYVYDVATGKELGQRHSDQGTVYGVAFSPDGKKLAFGTQSRNARLWDPATGEEQTYAHLAPVRSVAFSPDGNVLASASADGMLKVWELVAEQDSILQGIPRGSRCPNFSHDGSLFAVLAPDSTIKLYHLVTGQVTSIPLKLGAEFASLAFSPDGKTLALSSGELTLWDVSTGRQVTSLKGRLPFRCFALSPDSKTLATAELAYSPVVQLWDLKSQQVRVTLQGPPNGFPFALAFSPDGQSLVLGGEHEWVTAWDAATGKKRATLQWGTGTYRSVGCLAFSFSGKLLATGHWDGTVNLWDAATGQLRASLKGHTDAVKSIAFLPDRKTLVTGSQDRTLKFWDIATAQERLTLKGQSPDWHSVAVSPNGNVLATVTEQGIITLRRAATDRAAVAPRTELAPDDPLSPVALLTASTRLIAAGRAQEAEQAAEKARARLEKLSRRAVSLPVQYQRELASALVYLGVALEHAGRRAEAEQPYRQATALWQTLTDEEPADEWFRQERAQFSLALANVLQEAGRSEDAIEPCRASVQLGERLVADFPSRPRHAERLGHARSVFITLLSSLGRHEEAAQVAANLDPDLQNNLAWRIVVRSDATPQEVNLAVALAKKAAARAPKAGHILNTLGVAQYRAGDWKAAIETLKRADDLTSGRSFGFNAYFIAMALARLKEEQEAHQWYIAAQVWMERLLVEKQTNNLAGDDAFLPQFRAQAAALLGLPEQPTPEHEAAKTDVSKYCDLLLAANPRAAWAYNVRGLDHAKRGQWEPAAADFAKAAQWKSDEPLALYREALTRLQIGEVARYRELCAEMLRRFGANPNGATSDPDPIYWTAWTCVLAADAMTDWRPVVELAEKSLRAGPKNCDRLAVLGAALYRAGRFEEAAEHLTASAAAFAETKDPRTSLICVWLFQAMTEHRLGRADKANEWFQKAINEIDPPMQDQPADGPARSWNHQLTLQLLRREVEGLLKQQSAAKDHESPAAMR